MSLAASHMLKGKEWIKAQIDQLILYSVMMTLFFMPLSEGLKAAGFFLMLFFFLASLFINKKETNNHISSTQPPLFGGGFNIWVPPMVLPLLVFVGVAFLSAGFSDYPIRALRGALDALRNALVFIIIANIAHSSRNIKWILVAFMGGICIGDVVAIYQFFPERTTLNMLSIGDKNSTGQVLSFSLALILGIFLAKKMEFLPKSIYISFIVLTGFTLVLTYARTFWVALIGVLLLFGILQKGKQVFVLLLLITGLVIVGISFDKEFKQKVISLSDPMSDLSVVERFEIWDQALQVGKDHPVLGVGLKAYAFGNMKEKYNFISPTHSHNLFIHVFAELGVLGLLAFISWLWFYVQALIKMRPSPNSGSYQGLWLGGLGCFFVLMIGGIAHPMLGSESSLTLMTVLGLMHGGFRCENPDSRVVLTNTYTVPTSKFHS